MPPDWYKVGYRDAEGDLRCIAHAESEETLQRFAASGGGAIEQFWRYREGVIYGLLSKDCRAKGIYLPDPYHMEFRSNPSRR